MSKTHLMADTIMQTHKLIQEQLEKKNLTVDYIYEETSLVEDLKRIREKSEKEIAEYKESLPSIIEELVSKGIGA